MRTIVTGGCGYKGMILVQKLLKQGHDVLSIDAEWFGNRLEPHSRLTILKKDTRELTAEDLGEADIVFHLAAVASDPGAIIDSKLAWEVNVLATHQLLDACKRQHIPRFIFASSGSVYGIKEELEVTEDLYLLPISDYNKTKMVGERVVLSYQDDIDVTIIRPATVCGYSPRMRFDLAVNALTVGALEKGIITVFGGQQVRPNVHIKDIADSYIWCLDNPEITSGEIFNVGFENLSLLELADKVKSSVKFRLNKEVEVRVTPSNDPRSYRVSSKKILTAGFQPKFTVDDAINDLINLFIDGTFSKKEVHNDNGLWMQQQGIK